MRPSIYTEGTLNGVDYEIICGKKIIQPLVHKREWEFDIVGGEVVGWSKKGKPLKLEDHPWA